MRKFFNSEIYRLPYYCNCRKIQSDSVIFADQSLLKNTGIIGASSVQEAMDIAGLKEAGIKVYYMPFGANTLPVLLQGQE